MSRTALLAWAVLVDYALWLLIIAALVRIF